MSQIIHSPPWIKNLDMVEVGLPEPKYTEFYSKKYNPRYYYAAGRFNNCHTWIFDDFSITRHKKSSMFRCSCRGIMNIDGFEKDFPSFAEAYSYGVMAA